MKLIAKSVALLLILFFSLNVWSGGWDLDKGPAISTIHGELVCIGCSLKGGVGSNSQCGI